LLNPGLVGPIGKHLKKLKLYRLNFVYELSGHKTYDRFINKSSNK